MRCLRVYLFYFFFSFLHRSNVTVGKCTLVLIVCGVVCLLYSREMEYLPVLLQGNKALLVLCFEM